MCSCLQTGTGDLRTPWLSWCDKPLIFLNFVGKVPFSREVSQSFSENWKCDGCRSILILSVCMIFIDTSKRISAFLWAASYSFLFTRLFIYRRFSHPNGQKWNPERCRSRRVKASTWQLSVQAFALLIKVSKHQFRRNSSVYCFSMRSFSFLSLFVRALFFSFITVFLLHLRWGRSIFLFAATMS